MIATPLVLHKVHLFRNLVASILKRYARLFRPRYLVERRMGVLLLLDHGLYSIILDSQIELDAILAFEPVPSNLAQLRANLLMNNNCLSRV
jgi:hypothetical protein